MELYDTRTRGKRRLEVGAEVTVYVCGITPYDSAHLGHAATYLAFDVLVRYLEHLGHRVRYARNITDVDDDILRTARERGVDFRALARAEVAQFDASLQRLGLREPDAVPLATETVPAIAVAVEDLWRAGAAYALADGRVYFDTAAAGDGFRSFGALDRDEALRQFGEKGGDPEAPGKRDALDFLLWQPSTEGEPSWPSAFGDGRPGWHLECSVMAIEHLGPTIDVHGGGSDLVFPHHAAEVLQSEALTGKRPFARHWVHTGMVALDGTKMSKSLGNLVFLGDLLDHADPDVVRCALLRHHYRSDWSYDASELRRAERAVAQWRSAVARAADVEDASAGARFQAALDDDLDAPSALRAIDDAAAAGAGATVRSLAEVLGFRLGAPRAAAAPPQAS